MVSRDVTALATENFGTHATFPSRGIPEAAIRESPVLTWVDSGLDTDTFNIVLGARLEPDAVAPALEEVASHFASVGRPFSWWVSPGDAPADLAGRLLAGGLVAEERELAMACPLDRLAEAAPVAGLEIQRAVSAESLSDFARINAENWTPPDPLVERYYARGSARLLASDSPLRFYVARREGMAVAAVEIAATAGVLGVYNLSTRLEHRNAGIGGALLTTALRAQGAETAATLAVLQAAPAASGLYRRLGFEEFGQIAELKPIRSVR